MSESSKVRITLRKRFLPVAFTLMLIERLHAPRWFTDPLWRRLGKVEVIE